MLISEDLLLLATRDDGKSVGAIGSYLDYGLAAANVTDLVLAGRLHLSDDKDPRLEVLGTEPTGHPVLDASLARLAEKNGKRLTSLVTDGRVAAKKIIVQGLVDAGVIGLEEKRMLGMVPEKYPVRDPAPERAVRDRLRLALQGGSVTPHDATLLSILQGLGVAHKVLAEESGGLSGRELKKRIAQVADEVKVGDHVGDAVTSAFAAANASIMAAVIIPAAMGGSDGGAS